jgi:hypothetical protein
LSNGFPFFQAIQQSECPEYLRNLRNLPAIVPPYGRGSGEAGGSAFISPKVLND